jgi:hypothetical protein
MQVDDVHGDECPEVLEASNKESWTAFLLFDRPLPTGYVLVGTRPESLSDREAL